MASTFAILGCSSINEAESSACGTGKSRIDVRREAVAGYALADARTIDSSSEGLRVLGRSAESMDWKRSGCRESVHQEILVLIPTLHKMTMKRKSKRAYVISKDPE